MLNFDKSLFGIYGLEHVIPFLLRSSNTMHNLGQGRLVEAVVRGYVCMQWFFPNLNTSAKKPQKAIA